MARKRKDAPEARVASKLTREQVEERSRRLALKTVEIRALKVQRRLNVAGMDGDIKALQKEIDQLGQEIVDGVEMLRQGDMFVQPVAAGPEPNAGPGPEAPTAVEAAQALAGVARAAGDVPKPLPSEPHLFHAQKGTDVCSICGAQAFDPIHGAVKPEQLEGLSHEDQVDAVAAHMGATIMREANALESAMSAPPEPILAEAERRSEGATTTPANALKFLAEQAKARQTTAEERYRQKLAGVQAGDLDRAAGAEAAAAPATPCACDPEAKTFCEAHEPPSIRRRRERRKDLEAQTEDVAAKEGNGTGRTTEKAYDFQESDPAPPLIIGGGPRPRGRGLDE